MSKRRQPEPPDSNDGSECRKTSTRSEIGYCKPPEAHRFRPGQSGNPKGRPKGAKSEADILNELLNRKITLRVEGRVRKVSVIEAIHLRFTEDSLRGNTRSAAFIFSRLAAVSAGESQQAPTTQDDQEVLKAFARRLLEQQTTENEN